MSVLQKLATFAGFSVAMSSLGGGIPVAAGEDGHRYRTQAETRARDKARKAAKAAKAARKRNRR